MGSLREAGYKYSSSVQNLPGCKVGFFMFTRRRDLSSSGDFLDGSMAGAWGWGR